MQLGVNVPNFGPGTNPDVLGRWAQTVEGLGFDLLMVSDHVAVTADVAEKYPAPFYEPFTTLSWLAARTTRIRLGTTVLIAPYRHPLLVARMAANLNQLSGGRFVLGVGVGWARQEFEALGLDFRRRGRQTDEHLDAIRAAWENTADYGAEPIPIWVGGNSDAAAQRAIRIGAAWHPMHFTLPWVRDMLERNPVPAFTPRIPLWLKENAPEDRLPGVGTIDQVVDDLRQLEQLGAEAVLLDPFHGDPQETHRPQEAWQALAAVAAAWTTSGVSK